MYQLTTYFTLLAAIFDGLNVAPSQWQQTALVTHLLSFAKGYLPLFSIGLGWVIPAIIGFVLGLIWTAIERNKQQ